MSPEWARDIDDELLREDIALAAEGNPAQRLADADTCHNGCAASRAPQPPDLTAGDAAKAETLAVTSNEPDAASGYCTRVRRVDNRSLSAPSCISKDAVPKNIARPRRRNRRR